MMELTEFYKKYRNRMDFLILQALNEDQIKGDITSKLFGKKKNNTTANLICKGDCKLAGIEVFKKVLNSVSKDISFVQYFDDGEIVQKGYLILDVKGPIIPILQAERTALNFIQRMTGIATITSKFVSSLKYPAKILHTRKTTPNFRFFEISAVKIGGGDFHRLNLNSSVLIKDNHIAAAGSIRKVLTKLKTLPINKDKASKTEIEAKSMDEVSDIILYGKNLIKVVLLDNFPSTLISKAVKNLNDSKFKVEISGGINLENFTKYQHSGVDFYSIGMLTHSYKSVDFSLEF